MTIKQVDAVFRVYGDNILECEHFMEWLKIQELSQLELKEELGPIDRPIYLFSELKMKGKFYFFQLCPYYGGTGSQILWPNNPLKDTFYEKTDVVVTKLMKNNSETKPILAIEFCDALQAGNQAWQRFRRTLDAAESKIPYFYVLPLIGWERDSAGISLKNPRYQHAQVCIAQLTLISKFGVPSLQIYTETSWSNYAKKFGYTLPEDFEKFVGFNTAISYVSSLIRKSIGEADIESEVVKLTKIIKEMFKVAQTYSKFGNTSLPIHLKHPVFQKDQLGKASEEYANAIVKGNPVTGRLALHKISFKDFEKFGSFFYKDVQDKTCSREFKQKILSFLNWKKSKGVGYKINYLRGWGVEMSPALSSTELDRLAEQSRRVLPLTYKENKSEAAVINNRNSLRKIIEKAYPNIDKEILNWIYSDEAENKKPIFLIPLYAYKPSGDSRPDRGLLPMLSALFPLLATKENTLVIVYSKYTPNNWKNLITDEKNELLNTISKLAGCIIVDKTKDGKLLVS